MATNPFLLFVNGQQYDLLQVVSAVPYAGSTGQTVVTFNDGRVLNLPSNQFNPLYQGALSAIASGGTVPQAPFVLTDASTVTINALLSDNFQVTLAGNRTLDLPAGLVAGQGFIIEITQGSGGSHTLAYNAIYKFPGGVAPVLSTGAGAIDLLTCYYDGTVILASLTKAFA